MGRLGRFLGLSALDRRLIVRAWTTQVGIRIGLWTLPFGTLRRYVARTTVAPHHGGTLTLEQVAWAVPSAARYVPAATCLTQALAAKVLLARAGADARLSIGVDRSAGDLRAHAWLESGGRVIVGDHDLERFTVLPPIDGERP